MKNIYKPYNSWNNRFEDIINCCDNLNFDRDELVRERTNTQREISKIEKKLNLKLPPSYTDVLLNFSSKIHLRWQIPYDIEEHKELTDIFSGLCSWSLDELLYAEEEKNQTLEAVYPDPNEDEYAAVWQNKLAFHEIKNGDYFAFDLSSQNNYPVIYLSHDGETDANGMLLGHNFIDFINKWTQVACVGSEEWQIMPFVNGKTSGILPNCDNAVIWRKWLGLNI